MWGYGAGLKTSTRVICVKNKVFNYYNMEKYTEILMHSLYMRMEVCYDGTTHTISKKQLSGNFEQCKTLRLDTAARKM